MDKNFDRFVISIVIFACLFAAYILFFPGYSQWVNDTDRVGLAQLGFEIAGVSALLLAAWEFRKSQSKPKLKLWLSYDNPNQEKFDLHEKIEETYQEGINHHRFRFHLVLENSGDTLARWVKINVVLNRPEQSAKYLFSMVEEAPINYWDQEAGKYSFLKKFDGRDSFVIYSGKNQGNGAYGECENLGIFEIAISGEAGKKIQAHQLEIGYAIHADGIDKIKDKLILSCIPKLT